MVVCVRWGGRRIGVATLEVSDVVGEEVEGGDTRSCSTSSLASCRSGLLSCFVMVPVEDKVEAPSPLPFFKPDITNNPRYLSTASIPTQTPPFRTECHTMCASCMSPSRDAAERTASWVETDQGSMVVVVVVTDVDSGIKACRKEVLVVVGDLF